MKQQEEEFWVDLEKEWASLGGVKRGEDEEVNELASLNAQEVECLDSTTNTNS